MPAPPGVLEPFQFTKQTAKTKGQLGGIASGIAKREAKLKRLQTQTTTGKGRSALPQDEREAVAPMVDLQVPGWPESAPCPQVTPIPPQTPQQLVLPGDNPKAAIPTS